MAEYLQRGVDVEAKAGADRAVCDTVEGILGDIVARGDAAVRGLSIRFNRWDRDGYRLSPREVPLERFAGHGEQAIRARRDDGHNIPYAGRAESLEQAA